MANYTIKSGDTLSGIARANNTDVNTLMSLNPYITNANKIYAGKNLVLPDAQPTASAATQPTATSTTTQPTAAQTTPVQTATPVTQSMPTQNVQSIARQTIASKPTQQLAQEYATQQTANVNNDAQALLAQYEKIAEQQKQALQNQQQLTTNQINAQRNDVMQAYNDNARQAYINSMLGKKQVEQQLSQAGLNTSGLVGSAYANVENAYGNNLANLQKARDNSINDINRQLNDAQIKYAIQENQLLADIENAKLDLQKYNNQLAYQKYQDALNNYMQFANYDYSKAVDDRNYNYQVGRDAVKDSQWQQQFDQDKTIADRNYNYQVGRDKVTDDQWLKEYQLALKKANSSSSSSRSSSSSSSSSKIGNYTIPNDEGYIVSQSSNQSTTPSQSTISQQTEQIFKFLDKKPEESLETVEKLLRFLKPNTQGRQEMLQGLVNSGKITQEQANKLLSA